ncbi:MAG: hypothetical protein QE285_00345 [Aquabacterium sp.]|nr:hypothetical protein [Aquabacterium sp.]
MTILKPQRAQAFQQPRGRHPACLAWWMLAVGCVWAVSACQAQPLASPDGSSRQHEAQLQQRITAAIGAAACQQQADCRTLPLGAKACGGPVRWVAWSASQSDGVQLRAWADELAALQRQRQAVEGQMSNCSIVADAGAVCRAGQCVLAQAALAR